MLSSRRSGLNMVVDLGGGEKNASSPSDGSGQCDHRSPLDQQAAHAGASTSGQCLDSRSGGSTCGFGATEGPTEGRARRNRGSRRAQGLSGAVHQAADRPVGQAQSGGHLGTAGAVEGCAHERLALKHREGCHRVECRPGPESLLDQLVDL
jgi:hypothetical protein